MIIALGSARSAKIMALRAACARVAEVDARWRRAELVAREVETSAPRMPLNDTQLMRGAFERAEAMRALMLEENRPVNFFVGLEGGFHSITFEGKRHTFLHGWAYVSDGTHGNFGHAPAISVPAAIVARVEGSGRELGDVIDEVAGERDVRSRQGAWGVLSRGLLTRAASFEDALISALAPFYNARLYE